MDDPTEAARRELVAEINREPGDRERLEAVHGQVWDAQEMSAEFEVDAFLAPFIHVRRKSDGAEGTMLFQHWPRFYFAFHPAND